MTPLVRWFRDVREKLFGRFYDGPQPPERLDKIVVVFSHLHQNATKRDWVEFAIAHARESYRSGWVRGFEHVERDPDERAIIEHADPDVMADALDPDWRWSPEVELSGERLDVPVPEMAPSEREAMEQMIKEAKRG